MRAKTAMISALALGLTASAALAQEQEAPPQAAPPSAEALRRLRLRFEQEPTVQEVQRAVLRHYKVHPAKVEEYRGGNRNLMGLFVGEVMKATRGAADPRTVRELLSQRLDA